MMGSTFLWLPVKNGRTLRVDARSSVADILERLFGPEPWILVGGEWLRVLCAADPNEDAWKHLDAIFLENNDPIRVWREW